MRPRLKQKILKSESVIHAAVQNIGKHLAVAWTGGKDSTVLLHIIRQMFNGRIPFPVIFNDSTLEFPEVYGFIEKVSSEWDIRLKVVRHLRRDLDHFYSLLSMDEKKAYSSIMKIHAIDYALAKYKLNGFFVGIRKDEHPARSKDHYVVNRRSHFRVHPILHFTEKDVWSYIHAFSVPYVSLYDRGYRSLGEMPFTKPSPQKGGERSGREQKKERLMYELRKLGYW